MKINTKLGSISLNVSATPKAEKQGELDKMALQYLLFHKAPALAFKKGSGFTRADAHSPALQAAVSAAVKTTLESYFDGVEVGAGQYVKPIAAGAEKARADMTASLQGIGLDDATIAAAVDKAFPIAKVEEIAEASKEDSDEVTS